MVAVSEVGNERVSNPWLQPKENTTCGTPSGRREPERVSDREIANQSAGRIFTAGDTPPQRYSGTKEKAPGGFSPPGANSLLSIPGETTAIAGSFPESGTWDRCTHCLGGTFGGNCLENAEGQMTNESQSSNVPSVTSVKSVVPLR